MEFFEDAGRAPGDEAEIYDAQIRGNWTQAETAVPAADPRQEHGKFSASFCKWRPNDSGMNATLMALLKKLDQVAEAVDRVTHAAAQSHT